ncbi:MAG: hypothetical protein NT169_07495 [Chloroflexi bacterium]|nr:hypothetical protein [Chloroflexota bacterium]
MNSPLSTLTPTSWIPRQPAKAMPPSWTTPFTAAILPASVTAVVLTDGTSWTTYTTADGLPHNVETLHRRRWCAWWTKPQIDDFWLSKPIAGS